MILIFIIFSLLFIYPFIKISSKCSRREEEEREKKWLLQEFGKLKKD